MSINRVFHKLKPQQTIRSFWLLLCWQIKYFRSLGGGISPQNFAYSVGMSRFWVKEFTRLGEIKRCMPIFSHVILQPGNIPKKIGKYALCLLFIFCKLRHIYVRIKMLGNHLQYEIRVGNFPLKYSKYRLHILSENLD